MPVSPWHSLIRVSTSSTRTSAVRFCPASTCSTPAAMRVPVRTRRLPAGPSATAPRWRASSSAREVLKGLPASPPGHHCYRSGSPAGSPIRPVASPSTAGRTSFLPGSSWLWIRTRMEMRTTPLAWLSWEWWSRSPRSLTVRSRLPPQEPPHSTHSWSPPPATMVRRGRPTAVLAGQAGRPRPSRPARSIRGAGTPPVTYFSSLGFGCSSPATNPSAASLLRTSRCLPLSLRSPAPPRPSSVPRVASPVFSTAPGTAALAGRRYSSRAGQPRQRLCARWWWPARERCSSTVRCRPDRSGPTGPSRFQSSGSPRSTPGLCVRRCGVRSP